MELLLWTGFELMYLAMLFYVRKPQEIKYIYLDTYYGESVAATCDATSNEWAACTSGTTTL